MAEGLRGLQLRPSYSSGTDDLLEDFYVPALSRASSYDRIAGYFASSAFVSAAAGLARFVNSGGSMRMIVGAQLRESDCAALRGDVGLDAVLAHRLTTATLLSDDVERARLQVVAWMVREGRLEMRVGVACGTDGEPLAADDPDNDGRYFHIKTGILHDIDGNSLAFSGSINESSQGWSRNFEQFSVYMSWKAESWADYGEPEMRRFERLWSDESLPGWRIVALPEAFKSRLLGFVPDDYEPPGRDPAEPPAPEPVDPDPGHRPEVSCGRTSSKQPPRPPGDPTSLSGADRRLVEEIRDAPATRTGVGLVSAAVEPWPHQMAIARRILDTWPRSYLLADQVGLGKTIEVGLVLRELLLSGRATSALILVPASVLIQWQQELHEKFCLDVARIDGADLVFSDPARRHPIKAGSNPWADERVLLASSHLARRRIHRQRLLEAPGWDLVVLDEAHHARRRGSKPGAAANQMLALLRDLKRHRKFEALLLASATPMQMHSHELWDLLDLLGLPERWRTDAEVMARYFHELSEPFADRNWNFLRDLVKVHLEAVDTEAPSDRRTAAALEGAGPAEAHRIRHFADNGLHRPQGAVEAHRPAWDEWLRACTPVRGRVFRTTRATLRTYLRDGLLAAGTVIPERSIDDHFDELGRAEELYGRIDRYIRARYEAYSASRDSRIRGMGFIMTVYRRRLTSSFHAIRCSLQRRRDALSSRSATVRVADPEAAAALEADRVALGSRSTTASLLDDDDRHASEGDLRLDGLDDSALASDPPGADRGADVQLTLAEVGDLPSELAELDRFIADLDALPPDEPKMKRLAGILAGCFAQGHRSAVVFTQYADTLRYIRERLLGTYRNGLACYYGGKGEMWDDELGRWSGVGKEHIKSRFRSGDIQILIGTDSMSEGLNLQTCDVMVNFDMPWNFTRVEQRIGRLDRIGGMPHIAVHNLYYRDTVEVDIYDRLRERFDSFEGVLGRSAPVLAAMEDTLLDAAMGTIGPEQAFERIDESIRISEDAPISLDDLDAVPEPADELAPAMTLDGLCDRLLSLPAVATRLVADPQRVGVWLLSLDATGAENAAGVPVTFDRSICAGYDDVALLTWGSPMLAELLNRTEPISREGCGGSSTQDPPEILAGPGC
ncbi:MAG: DEAD/DEAH box helicase [Acidimicrobiaceae bacterium]|nr:DEAD/DEAH box helicase [Acidimicrobiaceae bacterium]